MGFNANFSYGAQFLQFQFFEKTEKVEDTISIPICSDKKVKNQSLRKLK